MLFLARWSLSIGLLPLALRWAVSHRTDASRPHTRVVGGHDEPSKLETDESRYPLYNANIDLGQQNGLGAANLCGLQRQRWCT